MRNDLKISGVCRKDPYKNFKFKVFFLDKSDSPIAAVSKVTALKRSIEVIEHRCGGDSSVITKAPGRAKYEAITLERGITLDKEFEVWANSVWNRESDVGGERLKNFRKDIRIQLLNETGQPVMSYDVYDCWVSEYQAFPDLDSNANAVAIQSIKLENHGWKMEMHEAKED